MYLLKNARERLTLLVLQNDLLKLNELDQHLVLVCRQGIDILWSNPYIFRKRTFSL